MILLIFDHRILILQQLREINIDEDETKTLSILHGTVLSEIDQRMGTTQALSALKLPRGIPIRLIGKGDNLRSLEVRFNIQSHHQRGSQNSDRSGLFGSQSCAKTTSRCRQ